MYRDDEKSEIQIPQLRVSLQSYNTLKIYREFSSGNNKGEGNIFLSGFIIIYVKAVGTHVQSPCDWVEIV